MTFYIFNWNLLGIFFNFLRLSDNNIAENHTDIRDNPVSITIEIEDIKGLSINSIESIIHNILIITIYNHLSIHNFLKSIAIKNNSPDLNNNMNQILKDKTNWDILGWLIKYIHIKRLKSPHNKYQTQEINKSLLIIAKRVSIIQEIINDKANKKEIVI